MGAFVSSCVMMSVCPIGLLLEMLQSVVVALCQMFDLEVHGSPGSISLSECSDGVGLMLVAHVRGCDES